MSELDQAVFAETNKLRKDPRSFIPYLQTRLSNFRDNTVWTPGVSCGETTNEGPAAVREAITFLENMQPISEVTWSSEMAKACRDHVLD